MYFSIKRSARNESIKQCRKLRVYLIVILALFAAQMMFTGSAMAAKTKVLKIQTAWATTVPILGTTLATLAKSVEDISEGKLKLKIYEPGKMASTLEIFDAVSSGIIDGGWSYPGYWVGKNSAINIFASTPFGPSLDGALAWYYEGGGLELWRDIYGKHNVYPILGGLSPQEAGGWYTKEIKSVADLKGLKVRWAGLGAVVLQELGTSTALIPVGEIATSLQKGIIDGAELGLPSLDKLFGMHKSGAKYYYFPGWHQTSGAMELLLNKDKWESLSAQEKLWIESAAKVSTVFAIATASADQAEAMNFFKQNDIMFKRYPEDVMKALKKTTPAVMAQESAKNPDFAKVWKSISEFTEKYNIYTDMNSMVE